MATNMEEIIITVVTTAGGIILYATNGNSFSEHQKMFRWMEDHCRDANPHPLLLHTISVEPGTIVIGKNYEMIDCTLRRLAKALSASGSVLYSTDSSFQIRAEDILGVNYNLINTASKEKLFTEYSIFSILKKLIDLP